MLLTALLLVTVGGGAAYGYTATRPSTDNSLDKSTSKPSKDTANTPDDSKSPDDSGQTQSGGQDDTSGYVDTPIEQPEINDPYPIENEHYKIQQFSQTSYKITLYPIANNPDYSNYDAQLRDYKNEALDYLKKRYGSTAQFTIQWSPKNAEDV